MSTGLKENKMKTLSPFIVEFCNPRQSDIMLQCIPGRLRMRSATGQIITNVNGTIKTVTGIDGYTVPSVPGMQLHVDPTKCTYRVKDPLNDKPELITEIEKYIEHQSAYDGVKVQGVPSLEGELDVHRMKSLCREIVWLLENGDARMVKGIQPALKEVQKMPGNFLLNPGLNETERSTLPYFEKDMDAWYNRMQMRDQ
jgi:hypothetical protein